MNGKGAIVNNMDAVDVMDEVGGGEASAAARGEMRWIEVGRLNPTEDNPREVIEDEGFEALVESIRVHGVLEPLLARVARRSEKSEEGREKEEESESELELEFDLRAGERRLKAAVKAGLKVVPVIVREMTDQEALEITVTENLHRSELHPVEEAKGIAALLRGGLEREEIARRLGKSLKWVLRRASLTGLSKKWWDAAIRADGAARRMSARSLEIIARYPPHVQNQVHEHIDQEARDWSNGGVAAFETVSATEIEAILQNETHDLSGAAWKLTDETLCPVAGACATCPKRSGHVPELFDAEEFEDQQDINRGNRGGSRKGAKGAKKAADLCLDPVCWDKKTIAIAERKIGEATEKFPGLVVGMTEYERDGPLVEAFKQVAVKIPYGADVVKKDTPGAQPVFWIGASRPGWSELAVNWVRAPKRAEGGGAKREIGVDGKVKPLSLAEKRKKLEARRGARVVQMVYEKLDTLKVTSGRVRKEWPALLTGELGIVVGAVFGVAEQSKGMKPWAWLDQMKAMTGEPDVEAATPMLWAGICDKLKGMLVEGYRNGVLLTAEMVAEDARRICELMGWDIEELREKAEEEIPEPKSWDKKGEVRSVKSEKKEGKGATGPGGKGTKTKRQDQQDLPDED